MYWFTLRIISACIVSDEPRLHDQQHRDALLQPAPARWSLLISLLRKSLRARSNAERGLEVGGDSGEIKVLLSAHGWHCRHVQSRARPKSVRSCLRD